MNEYTLARLFEDLHAGELSQVNLNEKGSDSLDFDLVAKKKIVSHLNRGLDELFTRFPLNMKEVIIQLYAHITNYELSSKYAESNKDSTVTYKYILDSVYDPFIDDVLRVDSCIDELGNELYVNDNSQEYSIFLSNYRTVQVPFAEKEIALSLLYRARHTTIYVEADTDEESTIIDLPPYLYEALLNYIAYRVHKARNNQESRASALLCYQNFNQICTQVEATNMVHDAVAGSDRVLEENGWV